MCVYVQYSAHIYICTACLRESNDDRRSIETLDVTEDFPKAIPYQLINLARALRPLL